MVEDKKRPFHPIELSDRGLTISRYFTEIDVDPMSQVEWESYDAVIKDAAGKIYFEQKDIEVPEFWSARAANVVAQKYFRGVLKSPKRERSVRQLISRVVNTITEWGRQGGYFRTEVDVEAFRAELTSLILHQKMSFNSPVWFNVGIDEHPQCSACFILSVADTMEDLMQWQRIETELFRRGSGTGSNLSKLREQGAPLSSGGSASGPVSFMRATDAWAGVTKSGGKTRRAALMRILNVGHPDIEEFVTAKAESEKMAHVLVDAGYDADLDGKVYTWLPYQNANHSVRVSDRFMRAVERDESFKLVSVLSSTPAKTIQAKELFQSIAQAAWVCGDPGLQFDDTINSWHPTPRAGRQNATNPCSEFSFLDDTACNLASLNLKEFQREDGSFEVEAFKHAIEITLLAQEIIVENSSYPTAAITANSHRFRPLGLGYANLGALLMSLGLPYDSDEGRAYAAAITALLGGHAYATSARIARDVTGPFAGYAENRDAFIEVIRKHRRAVDKIEEARSPKEVLASAKESWEDALRIGTPYGFRNAQVTVLAPTGTISFMMDCDTTGIEPDLALVKYKRLAFGGMLKIVNQAVGKALERLGYSHDAQKKILGYLEDNDTIEGAPLFKAEHLPIFDCAFRPQKGHRSISADGHLSMMAAVQPFLSGAISKTVNLPYDCTVATIEDVYFKAWKLGLKAIAVYRDGCKRSQPVSTQDNVTNGRNNVGLLSQKAQSVETLVSKFTHLAPEEFLAYVTSQINPGGPPISIRRRLPDERRSLTHKFSIAGHEGYIHVGMYEDGSPGEIFIRMAKEGSTISGLMDAVATAVSLALQHGVPLRSFIDKFSYTRFEPSGFTGNAELPQASSVMDYIFRWLQSKFLPEKIEGQQLQLALSSGGIKEDIVQSQASSPKKESTFSTTGMVAMRADVDAPLCFECGTLMIRAGACYQCFNCGSTSGCG